MLITEAIVERNPRQPFGIRDIAYIPTLDIVMCFVSKNASSFLKTYLHCMARSTAFRPPSKNPHMPSNNGFRGVEQLGHARMSALLEDPAVPKVLVGRHPVSRLVSAFTTRVATWQRERYDSHNRSEWIALRQQVSGHSRGKHATEGLDALKTPITWSDLVTYVAETPSGELDRHLVPQSYFAAVDLINYSLVGRVEQMSTFLDALSTVTGRPRLDVGTHRINSSPQNIEESVNPSDSEKKALRKRFRSDFEFFGYHQ